MCSDSPTDDQYQKNFFLKPNEFLAADNEILGWSQESKTRI
jgi:hypothetical protein